jgi:hypothetical protein
MRRRRFVAPRPGTTLSHLVKILFWLITDIWPNSSIAKSSAKNILFYIFFSIIFLCDFFRKCSYSRRDSNPPQVIQMIQIKNILLDQEKVCILLQSPAMKCFSVSYSSVFIVDCLICGNTILPNIRYQPKNHYFLLLVLCNML